MKINNNEQSYSNKLRKIIHNDSISDAIKLAHMDKRLNNSDEQISVLYRAWSENDGPSICDYIAQSKRSDVINYLIVSDPNFFLYTNAQSFSIIELAVLFENTYLLHLFINEHPDECNKRSERGLTPLHLAIANKRYQAASLLLDNTDSILVDPPISDCNVHIPTPLDIAIDVDNVHELNYVNLVHLLLKAGAKPHYEISRSWRPQPIHQATICNKPHIVKLLIEAGAPKADELALPQSYAIRAIIDGDLASLHTLLLKNPGIINIKNMEGYSLIIFAVIYDKPKIVRYLIEQGAERNVSFYWQGFLFNKILDMALYRNFQQTSLELLLPDLPKKLQAQAELIEDPIGVAYGINILKRAECYTDDLLRPMFEHPVPYNLALAYCKLYATEIATTENMELVQRCPRAFSLAMALGELHKQSLFSHEETKIIKYKLWRRKHPFQPSKHALQNTFLLPQDYQIIQGECLDSTRIARHFFNKALTISRLELTFFNTKETIEPLTIHNDSQTPQARG